MYILCCWGPALLTSGRWRFTHEDERQRAEHTNKHTHTHTTSGSAQDLCGNAKFVLAADRVKFGGEGEQRVRCDRLLDRRVESAAVVNLQTGARRYERRRGVVVGGGRGVPCP